jgi:hypothetical protein
MGPLASRIGPTTADERDAGPEAGDRGGVRLWHGTGEPRLLRSCRTNLGHRDSVLDV